MTATIARQDLAELEHVARKRRPADRLGRCSSHGGFLWTVAAARPACPVCGELLATTTSSLRSGFHVLEGAVLELAERLPGGLPAFIASELKSAALYEARAAELEQGLEAGTHELEAGIVWPAGRDADGYRRGHGYRLDGTRERAAKHHAKVAKLARRLERLGGPVELEAAGDDA